MKAWLFLIVAHVTICLVAGYLFQHRETAHVDHSPVIDTTTEAEALAGQESFLMTSTHQTVTVPGPLILYAVVGLLALLIGGAMDLYSFLRSSPQAMNHATKG
jgi:hypothetical protein